MMGDYFKKAWESNDPEVERMLVEAELVKTLLCACSVQQGATIEIKVTHDNGNVAVARLYDHAALVGFMIDAIEYFQSEL